ncbi:MAG: putative DNA binding domain-containing protein [Hespellia sp.]|nr:putative DNA binding domain-containing protein [Hespellia sp.]
MKDIIAFSNSTGGKVILGIEDETCIVYGIGEQSPFKLSDARKLQELELEGQGISYDSLQDIGRGFNQKKSFDLLTDNCNKAAKIQCALFKGIPRIISRCKEYGLQEPLFVELGDGFMVTMFRKPTNQTKQTNQSNKNEMKQEHDNAFSDLENKIIELLKAHPGVTTKGIVKTLEITDNQVKYY